MVCGFFFFSSCLRRFYWCMFTGSREQAIWITIWKIICNTMFCFTIFIKGGMSSSLQMITKQIWISTFVCFQPKMRWTKAGVIVRGSILTETRPPWPGTIVTICMSCFKTGGPSKEHGTNKPPPTGRVQERSKGDTTYPTTSQNPFLWHPSWLNKACTTWLAKDNMETNPITIKPETGSQVAELFSWVPLPTALHLSALSQ